MKVIEESEVELSFGADEEMSLFNTANGFDILIGAKIDVTYGNHVHNMAKKKLSYNRSIKQYNLTLFI